MREAILYIGIIITVTGCQNLDGSVKTPPALVAGIDTIIRTAIADTSIPVLKPYSAIEYSKVELLRAAPGTKSVLFNTIGSKLYAMNLEGMSIYEFDQPSRKVIREFKFKPTKGTGWDYVKDKPIPSYQEKPVEACLSHNDSLLWVSLHNAEGIVPIWLDPISANKKAIGVQSVKKVTVVYPGETRKDTFDVPLIKTGKTPKIISRTADNKYLLVSNWHSYNISVLEMNKDQYPFGKVISTVPVSSIPRGVVVDDKNKRSYVAIMGGASIAVLNNDTWKQDTVMNVESNPRHVVMDTSGNLFVSYNRLAKIACIDAATGNTLFTASTKAQPRTIILSKNHKFLFVTCYSSDTVDVFKINDDSFSKVKSLPCKGHPVGVDIFENNDILEAWVCSYSNGTISVFTFNKKWLQ